MIVDVVGGVHSSFYLNPRIACLGYWWWRCKVGLVAKTAGLLALDLVHLSSLHNLSLAEAVAYCVFDLHQYEPRPEMPLSSHGGEGRRGG